MQRLRRRLHALVAAWSTPGTPRGFTTWVVLSTLACVAITLAFAALSSAVQEVVHRSPEVAEAVAPMLRRRFDFGAVFVLLALVAAPLLETLLIATGASLARERGWSMRRTVVTAGVVFGLLHVTNGLLAIVPAACVFMVLTAAYVRWRPVALELALVAAALPHLATNAIVVAAKALQVLAR
jgi:membrane protease YdiL (CAAX protease family)